MYFATIKDGLGKEKYALVSENRKIQHICNNMDDLKNKIKYADISIIYDEIIEPLPKEFILRSSKPLLNEYNNYQQKKVYFYHLSCSEKTFGEFWLNLQMT